MQNVNADRLNDLVGWLADTAKSTQAFVVDQAPDVARQMIAWEATSSAYWMWGFIVAAVVLGLLFILCLCAVIKDDNDGPGGLAIVLILLTLLFSGLAFEQHMCIVKVTVAPKVFLIQECHRLLK